jgi:hypothetical protein
VTDANATADARWQTLQAALSPGGSCNTRHSATSGTFGTTGGARTPGVVEAGIDTVRLLYRLHDERQKRVAEQQLRYPADLEGAGRMKVGYIPSHEMIWAQGRPATVLFCERDDGRRLLPAAALPDVEQLLSIVLDDHGYGSAHPVGVSRVDSTVTIGFGQAAEGFALLRGAALLDVPRRKPAIYGLPPETVYWMTEGGQVRERMYDKGLEQGNAARGLLIRMEGQRPLKSRERTTADWWTMERVHEQFAKHFGPMAQASGKLHVASRDVIDRQLAELAGRGRISNRQAELLMGHIAAGAVGLPRAKRTRLRRDAELRRLGLAQALDGDVSGVDVDLGAVLEDALTSPHWNA